MARSTGSGTPRLCERLVVGVTGSVGALWAAQVILQLRADDYVRDIRVVMTDHAAAFVGPAAMRAVSNAPVLRSLTDAEAPYAAGHMEITEGAAALLVMPATANIIGKAAAGIADDAVSSTILAASCPVVFAPNMHPRMWRHPIVARNVRALKDAGYHVIQPATGVRVSTLEHGPGGLPSFEAIVKALRAAIARR